MKKQLLFALFALAATEHVQASVSKPMQNSIIKAMNDFQKRNDPTGLTNMFKKDPAMFYNWDTKGTLPNALMYAIYKGYPKVVTFLTAQSNISAHINDVNKNGSTALLMAVQQKNIPDIQALLKVPGIKTNIVNKYKLTAFGYANKRPGYQEIVTLLKEHGIKE